MPQEPQISTTQKTMFIAGGVGCAILIGVPFLLGLILFWAALLNGIQGGIEAVQRKQNQRRIPVKQPVKKAPVRKPVQQRN